MFRLTASPSHPLRLSLAGATVLATLLMSSVAVPAAGPKIVPAPDTGKIFLAAPISLDAAGYTEKEVFFSGTANRYRFDKDPLANAAVIDADHPYETRLILRAPKDPAKFNGTVIVEWLNVSTAQDVDFFFGPASASLLRDGYAYVGVTAQRSGIAALHKFDETRYHDLTLDAPGNDTDGKELDPKSPNSIGGDVLDWDLFTQIGQAVKSGKLLEGLDIKRVIAAGQSQSAMKLTLYYNGIHPLNPVYDAFLFYDRAGPLRTDTDTKVISLGTEFWNGFQGAPPADTETHRWWEIAGASHNSLREIETYIDPEFQRDAMAKDPTGKALNLTDIVLLGECKTTPVWSRVPNGFVLSAAVDAMNKWLTTGTAPPNRDRIVMGSDGKATRDKDGLVSGGVRTATYEVPTAINVGMNEGKGVCFLSGYHKDFSADELKARYQTPENYLKLFSAALDKNVADGVILRPDADTLLDEAKSVKF